MVEEVYNRAGTCWGNYQSEREQTGVFQAAIPEATRGDIYRFSRPASLPSSDGNCTSFWRLYLCHSSQSGLNRDGLQLTPKPGSKCCLLGQRHLFRDYSVTQVAPVRGTPHACVKTVGNRTSCVMGGRGDNCARLTHSKGHNKVPSPNINSLEPCIQSCLNFSHMSQEFPFSQTKFNLALSLDFGYWQLKKSELT